MFVGPQEADCGLGARRTSDLAADKCHPKERKQDPTFRLANELECREREYQHDIDSQGHISKVGRRTTRNGAKACEDGQRDRGTPAGS